MSPRNKVAKTTTKYLDPKIDVIFKMLFFNENHENILARLDTVEKVNTEQAQLAHQQNVNLAVYAFAPFVTCFCDCSPCCTSFSCPLLGIP